MPQGKIEHVRVKYFLKELNSTHPEKAKEESDRTLCWNIWQKIDHRHNGPSQN